MPSQKKYQDVLHTTKTELLHSCSTTATMATMQPLQGQHSLVVAMLLKQCNHHETAEDNNTPTKPPHCKQIVSKTQVSVS
jgi:hypothetical protein